MKKIISIFLIFSLIVPQLFAQAKSKLSGDLRQDLQKSFNADMRKELKKDFNKAFEKELTQYPDAIKVPPTYITTQGKNGKTEILPLYKPQPQPAPKSKAQAQPDVQEEAAPEIKVASEKWLGKHQNILVQTDERGNMYVEGKSVSHYATSFTMPSTIGAVTANYKEPVFVIDDYNLYNIAYNPDKAPLYMQMTAELREFSRLLEEYKNAGRTSLEGSPEVVYYQNKLKNSANEYAGLALKSLRSGTSTDKMFVGFALWPLMFDKSVYPNLGLLGSGLSKDIGMHLAAAINADYKNAFVEELKNLHAIKQCDFNVAARREGSSVSKTAGGEHINIYLRRRTVNSKIPEKRGMETLEVQAQLMDNIPNMLQGPGSLGNITDPESIIGEAGVLCMMAGLADYTLAKLKTGEVDNVDGFSNASFATLQKVTTQTLLEKLAGEYGNEHVNTMRGLFTIEALLAINSRDRDKIDTLELGLKALIKKQKNLLANSHGSRIFYREDPQFDGYQKSASLPGYVDKSMKASVIIPDPILKMVPATISTYYLWSKKNKEYEPFDSYYQEGYVLINYIMSAIRTLTEKDIYDYGTREKAINMLRKYMVMGEYGPDYSPSAAFAATLFYASVWASEFRDKYPNFKYEMTPHYGTYDNVYYTLKVYNDGPVSNTAELKNDIWTLDDLARRLIRIHKSTRNISRSGNQGQVSVMDMTINSVLRQLIGKSKGIIGGEPIDNPFEGQEGKIYDLNPMPDNTPGENFGFREPFFLDETKDTYTASMKWDQFGTEMGIFAESLVTLGGFDGTAYFFGWGLDAEEKKMNAYKRAMEKKEMEEFRKKMKQYAPQQQYHTTDAPKGWPIKLD